MGVGSGTHCVLPLWKRQHEAQGKYTTMGKGTKGVSTLSGRVVSAFGVAIGYRTAVGVWTCGIGLEESCQSSFFFWI